MALTPAITDLGHLFVLVYHVQQRESSARVHIRVSDALSR